LLGRGRLLRLYIWHQGSFWRCLQLSRSCRRLCCFWCFGWGCLRSVRVNRDFLSRIGIFLLLGSRRPYPKVPKFWRKALDFFLVSWGRLGCSRRWSSVWYRGFLRINQLIFRVQQWFHRDRRMVYQFERVHLQLRFHQTFLRIRHLGFVRIEQFRSQLWWLGLKQVRGGQGQCISYLLKN